MAMRKRSFPTGQSGGSCNASRVEKWPRYLMNSKVPARYRKPTELTDTVLTVGDEKFHVSKCILTLGSPVFEKMLCGNFKEAETSEANLSGKEIDAIGWMLDYLYPGVDPEITEAKAIKLLPLAEEYQLTHLKTICQETLLKYSTPRLEFVALAERYDLSQLLEQAINDCAAKVPMSCFPTKTRVYRNDILEDQQSDSETELFQLTDNQGISCESLYRICRLKLSLVREKLDKVRDDKRRGNLKTVNEMASRIAFDWL